VFAGDIAVCHFFFPPERNKLDKSFVYYYGNIDIQSNRNSIFVIPHNQQNRSKQSSQIGFTDILSADTYDISFLCKYWYIIYVQRPGYNTFVFDNLNQYNALRTAAYHLSQPYFFAHGWFSCT
jgi:hypothetical protein